MKIHIDIGQYEFIEIEKDEFTPEEVMALWEKFHKLTDKKTKKRAEIKIKHQEDLLVGEDDQDPIVF